MYGESKNEYELEVELDELCFGCPMLSLETIRPYQDKSRAIHKCKHAGFCSVVREYWENCLNEE